MIGFNEPFKISPSSPQVVDLTEAVFKKSGWLVSKLNLEHRPEQEEMALAAAQAFAAGYPLLFEAGTGVGKSLAYLIPALFLAVEAKRPCIVSTHTISLQEQIKDKDLHICRHLFQTVPKLGKFKDFKTALLVGRANYLCSSRLAKALQTKKELFQSVEAAELERIADWAGLTRTGLLHELNPPPPPLIQEWVNADAKSCNRRNCSPQTCFFQKARDQMRGANLIILNHSLLFSLMHTGAGPGGDLPGLLFANDFAVLDEAHTIPTVAAEQFGFYLSSYGLDRLLKRLYHPSRKRGAFSLYGAPADRRAVEKAIREANHFFSSLRENLLRNQDILRLYRPGWCEATLNPPLEDLIKRTSEAAGRLKNGPEREEMLELRDRLSAYYHGIIECITLKEEAIVYWVEKTGRSRKNITLRTAPIDAAPLLREKLFRRKTAVLLTSATLAEGPRMDGFAEKIGAGGSLSEMVDSPFHFKKQMRVFIASDAPPPNPRDGTLNIAWLADMIAFCALRTAGGSLVLFTSYADMQGVAREGEDSLQEAGRTLLMQGRDGSRTEITREFEERGNGILFGTDSFWAGVDIPGPSLSQVIITRLPFDNPNHPLKEAKSEWIKSRGGNPFLAMTLPEAVVKFRQGVGRLIRKKSDRGAITILDSRILNRPYGRNFIEILPQPRFSIFNVKNRIALFKPMEEEV